MKSFCLAASIAAAMVLVSSQAQAFAVNFRWCGASPEFNLRDVPKGTATLDFHMQDLMVPSYPHGGGSVPYRGEATIPCGSLTGSYRGPSPPPPQIHTYRWTVKALDASGKPLATATSERKFPE